MENFISTTGTSGELFDKMQISGRDLSVKTKIPPELTAARLLCRQLRRKHTPHDKQRIAHLICLNLLSMLRHQSNRG